MNEESVAISSAPPVCGEGDGIRAEAAQPPIPDYLEQTYWWAYLHPKSVWFFEREWLVNLILWGHMKRLTNAVVEEFDEDLDAPALQVACVYGCFSERLQACVSARRQRLHIADVAPIQLENVQRKLNGRKGFVLHHQDSTRLRFNDGSFARTVLFFLLHEQPAEARKASIAEAIRVTRPGGRVVLVDYHLPVRGNPLRYVMRPVLKTLEPFALDLWRQPLREVVSEVSVHRRVTSECFGGGLYQKVVVHC